MMKYSYLKPSCLKYFLLLLTALLLYFPSNAQDESPQETFSGKWIGKLLFSRNGKTTDYYFELHLLKDGIGLRGDAFFVDRDDPSIFARYSVKSTKVAEKLKLEELNLVEGDGLTEEVLFCYKTYDLSVRSAGSLAFMKGSWDSTKGCGNGSLIAEKAIGRRMPSPKKTPKEGEESGLVGKPKEKGGEAAFSGIVKGDGSGLRNAKVQLFDKGGNLIKEAYTRDLGMFDLSATKEVAVMRITAPGFHPLEVRKPRKLAKTHNLRSIRKDDVSTLKSIGFEQGSSVLLKHSRRELDKFAEFLKENPGLRVEIAGHTDNVGYAALNLKLSFERAKAVVNYLTQKGVSQERLEGKGYGDKEPLAKNDTEEGRIQNRRVEFRVLDFEK